MCRHLSWLATVSVLLICTAPHASATAFSGNPILDGWLLGGTSDVTGASYVGQAPGISGGVPQVYNLYSSRVTATTEILAACGAFCSAWNLGDQLVGLGAVFPTLPNQVQGVALLKWGVTSSLYSLSTFSQPNGNGIRDHNNGDGGLGSILATLNAPATSGYYTPTTAFQWAGILGQAGTNLLPTQAIVFNAQIASSNNNNVYSSFEGYLNTTLLNNGFVYSGASIVGYRTSTSNLATETNALIQAVPEPTTSLLLVSALAAGWLARRRLPARKPLA